MPMYEYGCPACRKVTTVLLRQYDPPASVKCEHCGQAGTKRLISRVAYKVAFDPKYSSDFTEKSLPFLKHKFPKEFEKAKQAGESEEATAFKINEQIGEQMDRMITKQIEKISQSR